MFSNLTRKSQPAPSSSNPSDASLDSILPTPSSRLEFILLIMLCTDRMRLDIDAVFDPAITSSTPPAPAPTPASPEEHGGDIPEGPPTIRDLGRVEFARRKRELGSVQVRELHRDAVRAFASWRARVLKRAGEVLRVKADEVRAEKARREGSGGLGAGVLSSFEVVELRKEGGDLGEEKRHSGIPSSLNELEEEKRVMLLNSLLLMLLSLEQYSAYSRVLMLFVASSLGLEGRIVTEQEDAVAFGLLKGARAQMDAEESRKRENSKDAAGRAWKVGLATVGGAVLLGVTGGLAAPFLAGAVGTVLGGIGLGGTAIAGLLGTLAGNFVVIGTLFGAYGGSMTGKMMDKYAKEVEDFSFVPLRKIDEDKHRLRVAIGISGWLQTKEDRYLPWLVLGDGIESFCLQWELDTLLQLGGSLMQTFKELAVRYAAIEIIKRTVFAGLLVALWPLGLLKIGKMLSNSFSVAQVRADKAGEVLADALIHKAQGERPVVLIGYSLGARVIYSCLQTLAKRRAFGLVESVVLMGLPASAESHNWRPLRAVVADRVVNAYSRNDYILGLVYRTSSITPDVAGLQPVEEVAGIENVDVSELVSGHMRYRFLVGQILERVGYESIDGEQLEKEKESLKKLEAQEEQMKKEQRAKDSGRQTKTSDAESQAFDWDEMLDGSQDAKNLNDKEIEAKLRELKAKEESEDREENRPSLPIRPSPAKPKEESVNKDVPPSLPARPSNRHAEGPVPAQPGSFSAAIGQQTNVGHLSEPGIPPWKLQENSSERAKIEPSKDSNERAKVEPLKSLHQDAAVTDDENEFAGHHITMIDDD